MRITNIASTDLFVGPHERPLQVVRVTLVNDGPGMLRNLEAECAVSVVGAGVDTPQPATMKGLVHGEERTLDVGVLVAAPAATGSSRPVTVIARTEAWHSEESGQITVAEPGWTMWMVSHFHYDPVWWNTQGRFAQTWPLLPLEDGRMPDVRTVFELVKLHLDEARKDPDYKFVLAELDYLKPYFDTYPGERADLLAMIEAGRIEIVGGSYNEPNTNLTCAESTIRNAIYGLEYQRKVLGANPTTSWMLDAFGFDPSYPGLMAAAGLAESSWARGPFHQWGPSRANEDGNKQMQFAAEFEWLSPDGSGLLTSYMPNHYSAGWITQHAADLATACADAYGQFRQLAPVSATRNVLLPVGGDHVVPSKWATAIHRDWSARYLWPRFRTAVPREYFEAVRSEAAASGAWFMPQTRDMNPVYPGKDVTYIDTKQAQRDAEIALLDGERLATLAWLAGADYPAASLDKAWRQLVFGAHHDAITGTEGDQVYLDLLGGWREAFERGDQARKDAARYLAGLADTASARGQAGSTRAVVVFNTISRPRSGLARIELKFEQGTAGAIRLSDESGADAAFLAEGVSYHPDGSLAAATLTFRARQVPAVGYRTYLAHLTPPASPAGSEWARAAGWRQADGLEIENETFTVVADGDRGGVLRSIIDRRTGTELLAGPGNELVIAEEYPNHPRWGEGPWLLCPTGAVQGSASRPATVRAERCPIGARLVAELEVDDLRIAAETLLWDDAEQVEFRTHVDGSIGHDRLLRVRFAADVPGGLPVFQAGLSVVGRSPGLAEVDVAKHPYTLDNPAQEWFAVGSTARVALTSEAGERQLRAIGVAEVIAPADPATDAFAARDVGAGGKHRQAVRSLLIALARQGVTATCSVPEGTRYGWLELDSNAPDVRIAVGGPEDNAFTARVLAAADPATADSLRRQLADSGIARVYIPASRPRQNAFTADIDLRGPADLPVIIVAGQDLDAAIAALIEDLGDALIEVPCPELGRDTEPDLAGHAVALLNRGLPSSLVTPGGEAFISLMRSCSEWPCGVWIDGDKRAVPDGSSFAWQHWSHTFEYALAAGAGDWRTAGFAVAGQDYNHPLLTCETGLHGGPLPAAASLASVTPAGVDLMALKPSGNPLAPLGQPDRRGGVTVRLRDLGGQAGPTTASIRLFTGLASARLSGLLEEADGEPVTCQDGEARVSVPERGTVTLLAHPAGTAGGSGPSGSGVSPGDAVSPQASTAGGSGPAGPGAPPEPAQPVFTRYWLHGKGPAPAGNVPVAVHLSPANVTLTAGDSAVVSLTVACGPSPAAGTVALQVPPGLRLGPATPATLTYDLAPNGFAAWDLVVQAPQEASPSRQYLTARITDTAGQSLEDAVLVAVSPVPAPPPDLPLLELVPHIEALAQAEASEAVLSSVTGHLELPPGGNAALAVRLANNSDAELHGEAQLISPHGSWAAVTPWTTGFCAPAGESVTLSFQVAIPADARPGQRWWALVKVMYFGRLRYSEPVWIHVVR